MCHRMWDAGRKHRYVWLTAATSPDRNGPQQALIRFDNNTGDYEQWENGPRYFLEEAVFITRPGAGGLPVDKSVMLAQVHQTLAAVMHRFCPMLPYPAGLSGRAPATAKPCIPSEICQCLLSEWFAKFQ